MIIKNLTGHQQLEYLNYADSFINLPPFQSCVDKNIWEMTIFEIFIMNIITLAFWQICPLGIWPIINDLLE